MTENQSYFLVLVVLPAAIILGLIFLVCHVIKVKKLTQTNKAFPNPKRQIAGSVFLVVLLAYILFTVWYGFYN